MNFFYEAIDTNGETVVGKVDATNEADAHRRLRQRGFDPQSIAAAPDANQAAAPPRLTVSEELMPMDLNSTQMLSVQSAGSALPLLHVQSAPTLEPIAQPTLNAQPSPMLDTIAQTSPMLDTTAKSASAALPVTHSNKIGNITLAGNAARTGAKITLQQPSPNGLRVVQGGPQVQVSKRGGASTKDQLLFFQQLASLVRGGISIYSALENLAPRTANKNLRETALEMAETARRGSSISDVMAQNPNLFPDHVTAMVKAGELGGFLEIALEEVATSIEQNIALYRWAWVPKLMAGQALFVVALAQPLFPIVFPDAEFGRYLTLVLLRNIPLALLLMGAISIFNKKLQTPRYRRFRDNMSLKTRPFGELQRKTAITNFVRTLRRMFHAGINPIQAWECAMNTSSNIVIREKLGDSYWLMQQGASLPEAFAASGLFTNSVDQLIMTGHHSGEIVESLDKIAQYYDQEVQQATRKSQFMIFRIGMLAMIILGGGALIWMAHTYFSGIFDYVDKMFPQD